MTSVTLPASLLATPPSTHIKMANKKSSTTSNKKNDETKGKSGNGSAGDEKSSKVQISRMSLL